jgi:hypothetical protein
MRHPGFRNKIALGVFALVLFVLSGCLAGGGSLTNLPTNEVALVKLKIRLGKVDSRSDVDPEILSKGSSIEIQNLVVTFTSSLGDTLRDTIGAQSGGGFGSNNKLLSDSVMVNVSLRALRWWNVDIETHDQHDSVVHKGSAGPFASRGGQIVDLSVPLLNSRYLMYEARYALPAEIYAAGLADSQRVTQKIYFHRLLLVIDEDTVRDSTSFSPHVTSLSNRFIYADTSKLKNSAGKLFFKPNGNGADTATHVQSYEYVKVGVRTFEMSAFGYLEGDTAGTKPRLLFYGKSELNVLEGGIPEIQTMPLEWRGPGYNPDSTDSPRDWNGISLTVTLGRVKSGSVTVGIIPEVPL